MSNPPNGSSRNQQDRVAAETLIRTSMLALANGAAVADIDEVIRRNASNVTHADIMAGRLNTSVLGDIITAVEQAKGSKPFNWNSATPEQIRAYQLANGMSTFGQARTGVTRGDDTNSGARYDGMGSSSDWNSPAGQAQMRDLAIKSGISWAANNPGLLRMGPQAIQTLAESHLKEESYKILKNRLEFSDKDVAAGAKYSNRNHLDYNDITKSTDKAAEGLPTTERKELLGGVKTLFNCKPENEVQCKGDFNTKVEGIKKVHPEKAKELDHLQKSLGTQKKAELKSEVKADAKDAKADALLAELNDPSPAAPTEKQADSTPHTTSDPKKPATKVTGNTTQKSAPKPT